jgi:hypothetical protein
MLASAHDAYSGTVSHFSSSSIRFGSLYPLAEKHDPSGALWCSLRAIRALSTWEVRRRQTKSMCMHSRRCVACRTCLQSHELAVVDYKCCGSYTDCSCDDFLVRNRALQHLGMSTGRILQLTVQRYNENRFSSYVLPRVVRLTIETNTLTGACPSVGWLPNNRLWAMYPS